MTRSSVRPSRSAIEACAAVRGEARRAIERGYRVDARSIDETAGQGVARVEQIVDPGHRSDAGWALLLTGVVLMRSDATGSVAQAVTDDAMVAAGMTFGAYLIAVVGDRLLVEGEPRFARPADADWEPPDGVGAVVAQAGAAAGEVVAAAVPGEAGSRVIAAVATRMRDELDGVDETSAGRALSGVGAWLSAAAPEAAREVGRSRVLGRPNRAAETGCALAGALIACTGSTILDDPPR